jgi:hypothetical protein
MTLKTKWIEILYNVATGSRKIRNFLHLSGRLIIDAFDFLRFTIAHGYTPLLVPDYQLAM